MSRRDFKKTLMADFVISYEKCSLDESIEIINTVTKVIHFISVDYQAKEVFGHMYRVGRRGNIEEVNMALKKLNLINNNLNASI